ncbi:DUF131 domain-containing protein [Methanolobus sp. ZRKC2]|uniref:TIGR00304 family membrane protein n=1 Tax=Methanolobus sp. ZRKC2 TaxID=3125783 RepID=UPI003249F33A
MSSSQNAIRIGILLIVLGFILVFLGMLSSSGGSDGEFGGVLLIGPIPIAFGSSPEITTSMLWAGVIIAIAYLLFARRMS